MVRITVQQLSEASEPASWCIIELQGTIERLVQPEAGGCLDLGTLHIPPQVQITKTSYLARHTSTRLKVNALTALCMRLVMGQIR